MRRALPLLALTGCLTPEPYVENVPPVAVAGADQSIELGATLSLDGSASHDPDGDLESWSWNLGDGSVLDGVAVQHVYTAAGRHVVSQTVVDDRGGQGRDELVVTVGGSALSAVAQVSPTTAQVFAAVTFDGSLSTPAADIVGYTWRFGDGASAQGVSASHAYGSSGRFRAVLEVADQAGGSDQAEVYVDVTPLALDGTYDLTATPAVVSCAEYGVSYGEGVLTLQSTANGLSATTDAGHSYQGTQDGLGFALSGSFTAATGSSCGTAPVTASLSGTFDSADHFTGTASAYYDLGVPCQCSALFEVEGQRR